MTIGGGATGAGAGAGFSFTAVIVTTALLVSESASVALPSLSKTCPDPIAIVAVPVALARNVMRPNMPFDPVYPGDGMPAENDTLPPLMLGDPGVLIENAEPCDTPTACNTSVG